MPPSVVPSAPPSADDLALLEATDYYPSLSQVTPALDSLPASCGPLQVPAGTMLFDEQAPCQGFPLVLEGEITVYKQSADGRRLELYRVTPGELCLVSAASLFRQESMSATGVSAQASRLLLVPPPVFHQWLEQAPFRAAVLGLFAQRMADLSALVDAVAFQKLDQRLAAALLGHGPALQTTHQQLADQLGTVREMVSRLLHRFEQSGWVRLSREHIQIVDSAALRHLAT